jgi:uncharacterized protein YicC (UPF0701 family)
MRLNHNKKRNTAFLYEVLIKELSVATINVNSKKKQEALETIKRYFGKNRILSKELDIYKSFSGIASLEKNTVDKILVEAKKQFKQLDRRRVHSVQSRLINEINKNFGKDSWNIYVANFKDIATINQILNQKTSPKDQVLLEEKLYSNLINSQSEEEPIQKIDTLTVQKFVQKFNDEYTQKLNESQRSLLSKYITSYQDDGLEFKMYLYEEIDRLKDILANETAKTDNQLSEKLNKVIEKIKKYNTRTIDKGFMSEVLAVQSLVSELGNKN